MAPISAETTGPTGDTHDRAQGDVSPLADCARLVEGCADLAQNLGDDVLIQHAERLRSMIHATKELLHATTDAGTLDSLSSALETAARYLSADADGDPSAREDLEVLLEQLTSDWGDCLGVGTWSYSVSTHSDPARGPHEDFGAGEYDQHTVDPPVPSPSQIQMLLSALAANAATEQLPTSTGDNGPIGPTTRASGAMQIQQILPLDPTSHPEPIERGPCRTTVRGHRPEIGWITDDEMRLAYLDDAQRCLASMEVIVLTLEEQPHQTDALHQIGRELHTLKGASGTVGLHSLAEYLHRVEDALQVPGQPMGKSAVTDMVLECVDIVRAQVRALQTGTQSPAGAQIPSASPLPSGQSDTTIEDVFDRSDDTIRVKASRIDRLMDLLAELITVRCHRESRAAEQDRLRSETARCAARIRQFNDRFRQSPERCSSISAADGGTHESPSQDCLTEVANDLLAVSRRLKELTTPLAEENHTVARLVRQFRQELVELQRMPLSGLFRKLQRVARDAARVEGKQVRLVVGGEHAGMERGVQEKLFEPLLHIVRNAVSHGIELSVDRQSAGKDPVGTIRLTAHGNPNLLVITVQDDGRGLDYDALRRRGLEMGLLAPDRSASRDELAQLIFHPGFSTKQNVTSISGRGVGMDVVADTLQRLGAWMEIESTSGLGTHLHLHIPLRSVIEHTMVFRSSGQLFAVPMHLVKQAGGTHSPVGPTSVPTTSVPTDSPPYKLYSLDRLFGFVDNSKTEGTMLVLGDSSGIDSVSGQVSARRIGILVDEVLGPEEIVVRSLPLLLQKQSLISGVTLAGSGETMLMIDGSRLLDCVTSETPEAVRRLTPGVRDLATADRTSMGLPALVVDDSYSVRHDLAQMLRSLGYRVTEASDGVEARDLLRKERFRLVISDLEMPRIDGFDLLELARRDPLIADVPIVIASSCSGEELRKRAQELGAKSYLVKPVSLSQLRQTLPGIQAPQDSLGS